MEIGIEQHYAKGQVLFNQGTPSKGVFLVIQGLVELYLPEPPRTKRLLRSAGRNCLLGLPATILGKEYSLTAAAIRKTEVRFIPCAILRRHLVQDPRVYSPLLILLAGELRDLRYAVVDSTFTNSQIASNRKNRRVDA